MVNPTELSGECCTTAAATRPLKDRRLRRACHDERLAYLEIRDRREALIGESAGRVRAAPKSKIEKHANVLLACLSTLRGGSKVYSCLLGRPKKTVVTAMQPVNAGLFEFVKVLRRRVTPKKAACETVSSCASGFIERGCPTCGRPAATRAFRYPGTVPYCRPDIFARGCFFLWT